MRKVRLRALRCPRRALFMLLSCCALVVPAHAMAQSSFPVAPSIASDPVRSFFPAAGGRAGAAAAQGGRGLDVSATIGYSAFLDESPIEHATLGGAVRFPLSRRWSVEPRFIYMRNGAADQDYYLLASMVYDFREAGAVIPYGTFGGGIFWHRATFGRFDEVTFVANSWHVSGGFGVRIGLAERWSLIGEARMGFEPIFQANGGIAYRF